MGWKHVIPQFIVRAAEGRTVLGRRCHSDPGRRQRDPGVLLVDDIVNGIWLMYARGSDREICHIGNDEEVAIRDLALRIGSLLGLLFDIRPGQALEGGTHRRCPDITKMRALGYQPAVSLDEGLKRTGGIILEHQNDCVANELM